MKMRAWTFTTVVLLSALLSLQVQAAQVAHPMEGASSVSAPGNAVVYCDTSGHRACDAGAAPLLTTSHVLVDPLETLPCATITTGGPCYDVPGPNEIDVLLGGSTINSYLPGDTTFQNSGSYQSLTVGRTDVPFANLNLPVAELNARYVDNAGISQNACQFLVWANSGSGLGPLGDLGTMTLGCNVNGRFQPALQIQGGSVNFVGGFSLGTPLAVPQAGGGEAGGYAPIDMPATNVLTQSLSPCTAPWALTGIGSCASSTTISPDGLADETTITDSAGGGFIRQTATVANNTQDYWACSVYVDNQSPATVVRLRSFAGAYDADYNFSTGAFTQTVASGQAITRVDGDPTQRFTRLTLIGQNPGTASLAFDYMPAGATDTSSSSIWNPQCEMLPVIATAKVSGAAAVINSNTIALDHAPAGLNGLIVRAAVNGVPEATTVQAVDPVGNTITITQGLTANLPVNTVLSFIRSVPSRPIPTWAAARSRPSSILWPQLPQGVSTSPPSAPAGTIMEFTDQGPGGSLWVTDGSTWTEIGTGSGGGGGTVTSIGLAVPSWLTITGSPVTGAGTMTIGGNPAEGANLVLASPNGVSGSPAMRALVGADLPLPGASSPGGVQSLTPAAHNFLTGLGTNGVLSAAQPACGDLSNAAPSCSVDATNAANISSGVLAAARLPLPSTTLGGVKAQAVVAHNFMQGIDTTTGAPLIAQPSFGDLTGAATFGQLPTLASNSILGAITAGSPAQLTIPTCTGPNDALYWPAGPSCHTITAGTGSVTSVGFQVPPSSIYTATGSPVTGAGTLGFTVAGNSGGVLYFSSGSAVSSSALLGANNLMLGGGLGAAPSTNADWSITSNILRGSLNAAPAAMDIGNVLKLVGADTQSAVLGISSFGNGSSLILGRADGTGGGPTTVQSGETLGTFGARGYDGITTLGNLPTVADIIVRADENYSGTAHGAELDFFTTDTGSTTLTKRAALYQGLVLGSPTGGDLGLGTINATGVYVNGVAVGAGGLAPIGNNTFLANNSGATAVPTPLGLPSANCNGTNQATNYSLTGGLGCTTISGGSGSFAAPSTIDATTVAGSDMCAQISQAQQTLAAINSHGGVIDARGFTNSTPYTCHNSMFAGWTSDRGFQVLLGPSLILSDAPQCVPNYDSLIGSTEYPNFASGAGSRIEASNNYALDSGHTTSISGTSGSFTITVGTANMNPADYASGTGIGPHAKVQSIVGNTVTLTVKNTGTVSGTGTFMPALVCMGTVPTTQTFHIHVQNIAASCVPPNNQMPTGCVDFQDTWSQEGSYFRNTYAGIAQEQYDLEFLTSVNPQNISPWIDLFAQQLVSTPNLDLVNAVCMNIGNPANLLEVSSTIDKLSCAAGSTTTALVLVDAAGVTIKDSHFENAIDGILIGSRKFSHGVTLESDSCGTGISTTCAELSAAGGSDGINILGLQTSGVTPNIVKDDQTGGCTLTEANVGSFAAVSYFRGGSTGTAPVLKGLWNGC